MLGAEVTTSVKPIGPDTPAGAAATRLLRERTASFFELRHQVTSGDDADAVHDMRVASRRLRAALDVFADAYPKRPLRQWMRAARRTTRALGRVRDADVLAAEFSTLAASARDPGEKLALAYLVGHIQGERSCELAAMRRSLTKTDIAGGQGAFERFARSPRSSGVARLALSTLARRILAVRMDDLERCVAPALNEHAADEQHQLRIAVKRLRYAVETLRPGLAGEPGQLLATLKGLQERLGALHDHDVFSARVAAVAQTPHAAEAGVPASGLAAVGRRIAAERSGIYSDVQDLLRDSDAETLRLAVTSLTPDAEA